MLRRVDLRGAALDPRAVAAVLPRAALDVDTAVAAIRPVVEDVRARGGAAVREATERFDGVTLSSLRVPAGALADALAGLDPAVRAALTEAARRARLVHSAQVRRDVTTEVGPGASVTERYVPVRRVGLYVPGGRVAYPSSVVMNVVPAQVAGVRSLAVASPPQPDGLPHPAILAACALLGVEEVYAVGGAQAIALLAYGAADDGVEPVDLITGPGNVYVAAAKRLVRGAVGIDAEAGPTEIAILADETADPAYVAADLVAQAEHDPLAACLLVTTSEALADAVDALLPDPLVEAAATVLVDDLDSGVHVVDTWAAEHLEVLTADAAAVAARVTNAGAIFVGPYAPVSLGDYLAGSNHVLPTAGTARHTGGLSVDSFVRGVHVVSYDAAALAEVAEHVTALGRAESLPNHVAAVQAEAAVTLPIRDDLRGRAPYGAPQIAARVRLNTNENPYPPSPALVADLAAAVTEAATTLNRYPDREAVALRADLAAYAGHDPQGTWAANGSNEVLQQVLMAFGGPGRTALGFEPSYSMHRLIAEGTGTGWVAERRAADFTLSARDAVAAVERHRPDVTFLCSPNNPTATALPPDVIEAVYDATDGVVVVDEAYVEFSHAPSVTPLLAGRERLVVTRTMSKAFAMAGTRVGYLLAGPAVVDALRVVRLPYHLSALTQAAARVALAHRAETLATVELVRADRDRLVAALDCTPSDANFVLFRVPDAAKAWQALLDEGVLVRDVGLAGWLRVTVGTTQECDAFLDALGRVV